MQFAATELSSNLTVPAGSSRTPLLITLTDDHPTNLLVRVTMSAYMIGTNPDVPITVTLQADEGMPTLPLQESATLTVGTGKPLSWSMGTKYRSTGNAQTVSLTLASGGGEFVVSQAKVEVLY